MSRNRERRPDFSVIVPVAPERDPLVLHSVDQSRANTPTREILIDRGPNPSRNRNRAAFRARANILAFTDDDCVVDRHWLANAAAFFRAHPDYDAVGGPQLNLTDEGPLGRATGHALGSPFGSLRSYKRYRRAKASLEATQLDLTSANLFLRRKAFDKWGPFDERLWPNEETALLHKIEKGGGKIAYDPSIVVAHKRRSSIVALARQCFGYGKGRARQTNLEGGVLPRAGHSVPCAFLLYLAALPLALWWSPLLMPLAAYALLSISISTATAWEHRDPATAPLMPFVFLTIHLAYPAGLIAESLRLLGHHKLGLTEPKRPRQSDSVAKSLRSHPSPTLPRAAASTRFAVSLNRGASTPTSRIRP